MHSPQQVVVAVKLKDYIRKRIGTPAILTEVSRGFPLSHQGIASRLGRHQRFQFIISQYSYHSTLCGLSVIASYNKPKKHHTRYISQTTHFRACNRQIYSKQ
jgi:hypothetical protein